MHPRLQSVLAITLPTNTGPPGYGREVVSASLLNTLSLPVTSRLLLEVGLAGGYTPASGALAPEQREVFAAGNAGLRWRFWGRQSLFGNFFVHSPYYHETGVSALDQRDVSLDFGWILAGEHGRAGAPQLRALLKGDPNTDKSRNDEDRQLAEEALERMGLPRDGS